MKNHEAEQKVEDVLLTADEVRRLLRVKAASTVRAYVRDGVIPAPDKVIGQNPRWIRSRFLEWLEGGPLDPARPEGA